MTRHSLLLGAFISVVCTSGLAVAQGLPPGGFQQRLDIPFQIRPPIIQIQPPILRPEQTPDRTQEQIPRRELDLKRLVSRPKAWRKKIRTLERFSVAPKAPPGGLAAPRNPGIGPLEKRVDPIDGGQVVREKLPDLSLPTVTIVAAAGAPDQEADQAPTGGWEAQYKRCRRALKRRLDDPQGPGLNRIVSVLRLEAPNVEPMAVFRNATDKQRLDFRNSVREYDAQCLTDPTNIVPPPSEIGQLAGVFTYEEGPFCSGFLVNRSTVVTARHCFFDDSGLIRDTVDPSGHDIQFHLTGDNQRTGFKALSLQENSWHKQRQSPSRTGAGNDYVFVQINAVSDDPPRLPANGAEPGDQLVIYSYNRLVYLADYLTIAGETGVRPPRTSFGTTLRWDRSPRCFAFATKNNCVYHLCQTAAGYSGAPMFRLNSDTNGFEFVGLHVSAMAANRGCAASQYEGIGNLGIVLGEDFQIASQSKNWVSFIVNMQSQ